MMSSLRTRSQKKLADPKRQIQFKCVVKKRVLNLSWPEDKKKLKASQACLPGDLILYSRRAACFVIFRRKNAK
jgi:hypothetical protein